MRGGVVNKIQTDLSEETLIRRILRDPGTTIEYVSRGTFGFIFKVTYRGTDASGFEDEYKKPVNVFILKVQGIDMRMKRREDPDPHKPESKYTEDDGLFPYSKQVNWDHHVVQEVLLQQQVYVSSIEKGIMPPCPSILYYGSITASELEKYLKSSYSYFVFEEYGQMPLERDYQHFRVAIIFMEYINGESLFNLSDELFWDQGLRNKAFRSYCTAIECGVLHRDPQPQNFLVRGDNVILIDFGSASKIISEITTFEKLIQNAEKGNCLPLIQALKAKDPDNLLDDWLFEPTKHAGRKIITTTLAPKTMLHEKKQACMDGRCDIKRRPLVGRLSLSPETIAENRRIEDERYAKMKADREAEERAVEERAVEEKAESARKKARCEKEKGCSVSGGKRRTRKTRRKSLKV
jgi:serine/threonine protein kinase